MSRHILSEHIVLMEVSNIEILYADMKTLTISMRLYQLELW